MVDTSTSLLQNWPNTRDLNSPESEIRDMARLARRAARTLSSLPTSLLDEMLDDIAAQLELNTAEILAANAQDLAAAEVNGLSPALIDRLRLTPVSLKTLIAGVRQVRALPQPLGEVLRAWERPNGLRISKVRVPIGVIAIIYESRPNVTIDAAVLCLKTGNATLLRGGREALHSNRALIAAINKSPRLPHGAVQLVSDPDRALVPILCQQTGLIDLIIPRGGKALIDAVTQAARVPVIKHADGICSIYVHAEADFARATAIILNAKTQRPGVCNAVETLLVDRAIADRFLPDLISTLLAAGVEVRGDETVLALAPDGLALNLRAATEADWATEFLDLILAVRVVDGVDAALAHLDQFSSHHSDAIITENLAVAERFLHEVDSATVYWNASTRFTDGGEFGFGAEIGISTDKLHARGPMGLEELTSYKYLLRGQGQVR